MEVERMRKYAIFVLGIAACLAGAALMAFGEGLVGENHTGIATVIGIVGIGLIASSSRRAQKKQDYSNRGVRSD